MTKLISKAFSKHVADQFIESISEPANSVYYVAASRHTPYTEGDDTVPTPVDTVQYFQIDPYQQMVFGKKINSSDVSLVIPRYNWTSNTVYDRYDHTDSSMYSKMFYVAVDAGTNYYVYKVLDNAGGAPSTVQPSSTVESACNFITTGDGYKWKLMYKLPEATFEKFATSTFMPVQTSANVSAASVDGALDVVKIVDPGQGYISTLTGQFTVDDLRDAIPSGGNEFDYRLSANASANTDFYAGCALYISGGTGSGQLKSITTYNASTRVATVNGAFTVPPSTDSTYIVTPNILITGDGSGAAAYAAIASNSTLTNFVSDIVVVNRGADYSYATASVVGNTGGVVVTTNVVPIIPPVGGHGTDAALELGSYSLCISTSFSNTESGFISTENDYRSIMILKDPKFDGVTFTISNDTGTFSVGETISQVAYSLLTGTVSVNTTTGAVVGLGTDFVNSLEAGDKVIIFDTVASIQSLRTVSTVTNSTAISLTTNNSFTTSYASIAKASILASGVKTGNSTPYIQMTSVEPKFVTGRPVIGHNSGAFATVDGIEVNEKSFNSWNTFDNRTRITYTSTSGSMPEDAQVYQVTAADSNAYFHSANSTHVFLTSEKGTISATAALPLVEVGGVSSYVLSTTKYSPDIEKHSGQVIYIENSEPISRSNSQSESFKVVLKF